MARGRHSCHGNQVRGHSAPKAPQTLRGQLSKEVLATQSVRDRISQRADAQFSAPRATAAPGSGQLPSSSALSAGLSALETSCLTSVEVCTVTQTHFTLFRLPLLCFAGVGVFYRLKAGPCDLLYCNTPLLWWSGAEPTGPLGLRGMPAVLTTQGLEEDTVFRNAFKL